MVLFRRGVPTERHPSPNEIYLVVEVSETTLKQHEGKKLLAYQDAGIPEYWIIDVAAKVVRIHRLNQAKIYYEETPLQGHDRLTSVSRCHDRPGESLLIA
jgi:Uma2 family endonuclease